MTSTTKKTGSFGFKSLFSNKKVSSIEIKRTSTPPYNKFDYASSEPTSVEDLSRSQVQPVRKLNSQSPASEIPKTWREWNAAYLEGKIDFEDPPPPPDTLESSSYTHESGGYLAPRRLSQEILRQRALDELDLLETKKSRPSSPSIPISRKKQEHPELQLLVERAQKIFGVEFAGVNLVDEEYVVFLANVGFEGYEGNPRDSTVCAHSLLAASNGDKSTVILDLKKDWRFKDSKKHQGFYASFPINVEPTMGDKSTGTYPVGLLCAMDPKPRKAFTAEERLLLEELAAEAGVEIARFAAQKKANLAEVRAEKHDEWSEASIAYGMETLANGENSRNNSVTSIPPSYENSTADPHITNLDIAPVFPRRRAVRSGVLAPKSDSIPPGLRKIFDLATTLLAETLSFDYVYLLSVDLNPNTPPSQALLMISNYNPPTPPPLFDFQLHLDPIQNSSTSLYNNPDYPHEHVPGTFATGMVMKVGVSSNVGFVLAGFSEDRKKVFGMSDFLFFSNYATDLTKYIGRI